MTNLNLYMVSILWNSVYSLRFGGLRCISAEESPAIEDLLAGGCGARSSNGQAISPARRSTRCATRDQHDCGRHSYKFNNQSFSRLDRADKLNPPFNGRSFSGTARKRSIACRKSTDFFAAIQPKRSDEWTAFAAELFNYFHKLEVKSLPAKGT